MSHAAPGTPVARAVAFYLPQYHPIDLNDSIYGQGFTEWTHVRAARPLFRGHQQPVTPGELGYYDLRDADVRQRQAQLADDHGIEGFVYWHYWSDGQRLLETPFQQVLECGEPDFGFCLAWANHSWKAIGGEGMIFEQEYPGSADIDRHFASLEPAFHDRRYLTVDGSPIFYLFRPAEIPDLEPFCDRWRDLARRSGLPGLHFVGQSRRQWDEAHVNTLRSALDGMVPISVFPASTRGFRQRLLDRIRGGPLVCEYSSLLNSFPEPVAYARESYPCVVTNWDSTPRWGRRGEVLRDVDTGVLRSLMRRAIFEVIDRPRDHRLLFLKSWNEWAEGNHLEPDDMSGRDLLDTVRSSLLDDSIRSDPT